MKRIGIKDIARIADVSRGTVDRALHGRSAINQKTRDRILQIAQENGYKPNLAARMLVSGRAPLAIGVCIPREIRYFFDQVRDGILEEARRYESVGVTLEYRPSERYGEGEYERIEELLSTDIKGLIVAPGIDPRTSTLIDEAEGRGIKTVLVAGDIPASRRSTALCSDPELNGTCAAELMARFLHDGFRVVVFTGMIENEIHSREVRSFCEAFQQFAPRGRVLEVIEHHDDEAEAYEKCAALLGRTGSSVDGIYLSTANCLPVLAALDAAGAADKVKLVTTDLFPGMVPWFERGTILASIYQRPYIQGQTALRLIVDHLVNGLPFPPTCYLNPLVALRSNLRMFREISHQGPTEKETPRQPSPWLQAL